ncbi:unnamed protein product, partial [Amoebophrya sp. A120]|eukprot:GSA120T00009053001.1
MNLRSPACGETVGAACLQGNRRAEAMREAGRSPDFIKKVRPMASGTPNKSALFFVKRPPLSARW